jgi:Ras-related protein Rab-23
MLEKQGNDETLVARGGMEDLDVTLKILITGNGSVGKSSLIARFARGLFTENYKKTLGVDFLERSLVIQPNKLTNRLTSPTEVTMFLYDTAGQEEYWSITRSYYRGASGCVIVFSTTDRDSFLAVRKWYAAAREECGNIPIILMQNKSDLIKEAVMTPQEVESLVMELGIKLYRASVKENLNVEEVFVALALDCFKMGLPTKEEQLFKAEELKPAENPDSLQPSNTQSTSLSKARSDVVEAQIDVPIKLDAKKKKSKKEKKFFNCNTL